MDEPRLIKTLLSRKPDQRAFNLTAGFIVVTILFTLLFWQAPEWLAELLPVSGRKLFSEKNFWRAFTAALIHSDIEHLLSNLVLLVPFGFFVAGYFGYWVFPIVSLALAAVINIVAVATYPLETELLGASGLVYFLGAFWLMMYFFIQRQYRIGNRLLRVAGIAMVLFLPSTFTPTTSYRTHAIGFFVGVLAAIFYFWKNKKRIQNYEIYTEPEPKTYLAEL